MSIRILDTVWQTPCYVLDKDDKPTKKLSPPQKLVLLALADNADDHGYCWPSIATIAKKCCLSPRSVYEQIAALEKQHLVKRQAKHGRITAA